MKTLALIAALLMACTAQAGTVYITGPDGWGIITRSYTAATSPPPAYIYPTNGQALAGMTVYNWGSAGNGLHSSGVWTQRGASASAINQPATDLETVRFSASWLLGATQVTILAVAMLPEYTSGPFPYAQLSWGEWGGKAVELLATRDYNAFLVSIGSASVFYYGYSRDWPATTDWGMFGFSWSTGTVLRVLNGAPSEYTQAALPPPTAPLDATNTYIYVDMQLNSCFSDIFATTNTISWEQITNWYYQTATATYNSNWPALFTGDVEVTWREYVP